VEPAIDDDCGGPVLGSAPRQHPVCQGAF